MIEPKPEGSKGNKVSQAHSVRLSAETYSALAKIVFGAKAAAQDDPSVTVPTFAELLEEAWGYWQAHKAATRADTISPTPVPPGPQSSSESLKSELKKTVLGPQFSPGEMEWLGKFLKVLRSQNKDFVDALQSNLLIFARFCDEALPNDEAGSSSVEPSGGKGGPEPGGTAAPHPAASKALREKMRKRRKDRPGEPGKRSA